MSNPNPTHLEPNHRDATRRNKSDLEPAHLTRRTSAHGDRLYVRRSRSLPFLPLMVDAAACARADSAAHVIWSVVWSASITGLAERSSPRSLGCQNGCSPAVMPKRGSCQGALVSRIALLLRNIAR
eukprot:gene14961-biopygen12615